MGLNHGLLLLAAGALALALSAPAAQAQKDYLYIKPGAAPGGTGHSPNDALPSIQQALDSFTGPIGYVFLSPGTYQEDIVISKGRFWLRPESRQSGVTLEGSITVRTPNIVIRGLDIRSEGSGIILGEGATGCQILQCRMLAVGEGQAGIDIVGDGLTGLYLSDNIVDLRAGEGQGRTGIRLRAGPGVTGAQLDHNQMAGCETGIAVVGQGAAPDAKSTLTSNRLIENGVGLAIGAPGVLAARNEFRGNTTAAVQVQAGPTVLDGNHLTGDATGVVCAAEDVTLTNNVIAAAVTSAVQVASGSATLLHNTLCATAKADSALVEVAAGATATARHNILAAPGKLLSVAGMLTAARNLYSHQPEAPDAAAIIGDPRFADAANGDYRLKADSPAAHQASRSETGHDAAGTGRPWGPQASLGAYEVAGKCAVRTSIVAPGATGGDGSAKAPFGTIPEALAQALPGDTIILRAGQYPAGTVEITRSGAPGALLTIRSEQPHAAKLPGTVFALSNCSYVRLEGLDFTGMGAARPIGCGPYVTHCEFVNNLFVRKEEGGGAIGIGGPGATDHLIEGNRLALTKGGVGIQVSCQRYNWRQTIRNNDISGCYYGVQLGGGSYPTAPPGYCLIEGNRFHDNWVDGLHSKTTDNTVRGNHFDHNANYGLTVREGARHVIVGNWIHDNGRGVRLHSPSQFVLNNAIYHNRGGGITILQHTPTVAYEAADEVWVAHNTIWDNGGAPISIGLLSQAMILRNLIVGRDPQQYGIVCTDGGVIRQADGNLYHHVRPPLLREYEGGRHDRIGDPLARDPEQGDFRPQPGGPAWHMPQIGDVLSFVLSITPAGVALPTHLGSDLGPPPQ